MDKDWILDLSSDGGRETVDSRRAAFRIKLGQKHPGAALTSVVNLESLRQHPCVGGTTAADCPAGVVQILEQKAV